MTNQAVRVLCKLVTLSDGTEAVRLGGVELARVDPKRSPNQAIRLPKEKLIEAQGKMGEEVFYRLNTATQEYEAVSGPDAYYFHRCRCCGTPFIGLSIARYCQPSCLIEMVKRKSQLQRERNAAHWAKQPPATNELTGPSRPAKASADAIEPKRPRGRRRSEGERAQ